MVSKKKQHEYDLANNLCCNPFRKKRCGRAKIETYIFYDGEKLPVCSKCWQKISKEDWELKDGKITLRVVKDREEKMTKLFKKLGAGNLRNRKVFKNGKSIVSRGKSEIIEIKKKNMG